MGLTQGGRSVRPTTRTSVGGERILGFEARGAGSGSGEGGSPSGAADGPDITGTFPDGLALKAIPGLTPQGNQVIPGMIAFDGKGRIRGFTAGVASLAASLLGAPNGVARLGPDRRILTEELPAFALRIVGTWDPTDSDSRPFLVPTGIQETANSDSITQPIDGSIYISTGDLRDSNLFGDPAQRIRRGDWAIWEQDHWIHLRVAGQGITSINGLSQSALQFGVEDLDPDRSDLAKLNTVLGVTLDVAGTPRPPGGNVSGGDLSGAWSAPTLAKIMGRTLSTRAPLALEVLSWDPTAEGGDGRIVWRTVGSVFASLSRFGTTVPAHIAPGRDLTEGNPYTLEYSLTHASQIASARLIIRQVNPTPTAGEADTVILNSIPIQEGSNMAAFNWPGSATLPAAGNRFDIIAQFYRADEGAPVDGSNPELTGSESVIANSANPGGHVYFGLVDPTGDSENPRPVAAAALVANAGDEDSLVQAFTKQSGDYAVPTFTGNKYLLYAFPQSQHDVLSFTIGASTNQIQGFTRTAMVQVGSPAVNYIFYISNMAQAGSRLSGQTVHIERRG